MKTKRLIRFLIILVIVLSIGLIYTTSKLINTVQMTPSEINNKIEDIVLNNLEKEDPKDSLPLGDNEIDEDIELDSSIEPSNESDVKNNNVDKVVQPKDKGDKGIVNPPVDEDPNEVKGIDEEKNPKDNSKKNNGNNNNNNNKNNNKKDKSILDNSIISKDRAIEIGLKKVGSGGKLEDISPKLNDNPPKYSLEILKNKHKYSIEIHARTGAILEHDKIKIND